MRFFRDILNPWRIFYWVILLVIVILLGFLVYLFTGQVEPADRINFGVTFSQKFAQEMGLDWREAYLEKFRGKCATTLYEKEFPFNESSLVLVLSHSFSMDRKVLAAALERGCAYVGLLSSTKRRDAIFQDLADEGIPAPEIARVRSPVGIDITARSDAEIAVGIVAELIGFKNS